MTRRTVLLLACLALLSTACDRATTEVATTPTIAETTTTTTAGPDDTAAGTSSTTAPADRSTITTTTTIGGESTTTTTTAETTTTASTFPEEATTTTAPPDVLLVTPYGRLGGVEIGTDFDTALPALVDVFGQPDVDTGWEVGCPLDGEDENERILRWGALEAHFYLVDTGRLVAWTIAADAGSIPRGATVVLPGGSTLGEPMSAVAASTGLEVVLDGVFEAAIVTEDGYTLWGFPDSLDAPLSLVGVPFVPVCE
jgi:hypothetical protein